jgi:hypothetical protein
MATITARELFMGLPLLEKKRGGYLNIPTSGKGNNVLAVSAECGEPMSRRFERRAVVVLLVSYVLTVFGGAGLHSHAAPPADGGVAWTTHACGDRELHIPLDELSRCAFCLAGHSRAAILPPDGPVRLGAAVPLIGPLTQTSIPGAVDLFSSGKRGPPLS